MWVTVVSNEYGILMQGIIKTIKLKYRIKGIKSMKFIKKHLVPKHKIVTYAIFLAYIRPKKDEPNRMRHNVGGNILEYDENNSTETLVLEATKILVSSVISTPGAIF